MDARVNRRLVLVWWALSTITVLGWWLSSLSGRAVFVPNPVITFGVIALALVKVRLIMQEFMEVRHAPKLLSRLTDTWLVLTGTVLIGTYLVGLPG